MGRVVVWSRHSDVAMREREIERAWVIRAIEGPDWIEPDSGDPALKRAFAALPERGGRILRVVYRESETQVLVITAFLDRGARRP